jgi:hypothetical protein
VKNEDNEAWGRYEDLVDVMVRMDLVDIVYMWSLRLLIGERYGG